MSCWREQRAVKWNVQSRSSSNGNFDIGTDTGTPVSDDYQVPFRFAGKLDKLTLTIDRPQLSPADIRQLEQTTRNNRVAE
jgi:arylsulfatase